MAKDERVLTWSLTEMQDHIANGLRFAKIVNVDAEVEVTPTFDDDGNITGCRTTFENVPIVKRTRRKKVDNAEQITQAVIVPDVAAETKQEINDE